MKHQNNYSLSSRLGALILSLVIALPFSQAQAQATPSREQIEQFKNLPPSQQKALAESMGIDLDDYTSLIEGGKQQQGMQQERVSGPRGNKNQNQGPQYEFTDGDDWENEDGEPQGVSLLQEEKPDALKQKIELFGYDVFDYGADTFTPATDIPIPADYVLGPGDSLTIQLYGKENDTMSLTLDREGRILFPNIGPVTLAGLTFTQASNKIDTVVSEQMIGVKASTTMGALRTIRVFVLGEANVPGSYVVGSLSTMTNAIFASGGVTKIGSLRNIQLKRRGKVVTNLDLYDLLLNGDTSKDVRLLPGDVIFIPPIGETVGVAGQVKRPAIYELKREDSVQEVLQLAGGLLPTAYMPASRIERITPEGEKTLVNLDLSTRAGRDYQVQDADIIQIFSTLETMRDIVKLEGHVKRPGGFAWRPGLRFTDVVPSVDDMMANPDIHAGLILREVKSTRQIYAVQFSPARAFANPASGANPELESRDTIILFDYETPRSEILSDVLDQLKVQAGFNERQQIVRINGSVRFPGSYPLSRGMTTSDLIKLAGGLTEAALGTDGEITRYALDQDRHTMVMHIGVNLNNQDVAIQAGDTLQVKQIPMWKEKEHIEITGEVLHPGTYSVIPGETLIDVLARAGGLTPHAYPEGAIFSREELRELEAERLEDLKEQVESEIAAGNLTESVVSKKEVDKEQAEQILANIEGVKPLGRMVIDLPAILENPEKLDFQVEDGDVLNVPRFKPSVTVVGEVQHPTSHFYDGNLTTEDYIERSGGTKENADTKRVYIVKANGRVFLPSNSAWFKARSHNIEPGDTIIVPLDTDKVDRLTMWSSVTSIMYQAALGITAISRL